MKLVLVEPEREPQCRVRAGGRSTASCELPPGHQDRHLGRVRGSGRWKSWSTPALQTEPLRNVGKPGGMQTYETLDGLVSIVKHPHSGGELGGWGYTSWEAYVEGEEEPGWQNNDGHFATLDDARIEIMMAREKGLLW